MGKGTNPLSYSTTKEERWNRRRDPKSGGRTSPGLGLTRNLLDSDPDLGRPVIDTLKPRSDRERLEGDEGDTSLSLLKWRKWRTPTTFWYTSNWILKKDGTVTKKDVSTSTGNPSSGPCVGGVFISTK